MLINGAVAVFREKEIVKSFGAKSTASRREVIGSFTLVWQSETYG